MKRTAKEFVAFNELSTERKQKMYTVELSILERALIEVLVALDMERIQKSLESLEGYPAPGMRDMFMRDMFTRDLERGQQLLAKLKTLPGSRSAEQQLDNVRRWYKHAHGDDLPEGALNDER